MESDDVSTEQDENQPPEAVRAYAKKYGLVPTFEAKPLKQVKKGETAPESSRATTIYRRPGYDGVLALPEIERRIGEFLRTVRDKRDISQYDFAVLLGITGQVWGRYERSMSSLDVSRLIVLTELLGLKPTDLLGYVAPHLFGETPEGAKDRIELIHRICELPDETATNLLGMVKHLESVARGMKT